MYTFGKSILFKKLTNVGDRGSARLSYQLAITRIVNVVTHHVSKMYYQMRCNHSIISKISMYLPINSEYPNINFLLVYSAIQ